MPKKSRPTAQKGQSKFREKQKEEQKMRESIRVGDEITTIGGILGRVVKITEETVVIETGKDRTKLDHNLEHFGKFIHEHRVR